MFTAYQMQVMMQHVFEERLRYATLRRVHSAALRRSHMRSTLRRAIRKGLRCGLQPHEVEHAFTTTLQQVSNR